MNNKEIDELLSLLQLDSTFKLNYEVVKNGITIYINHYEILLEMINYLGSIGAYFNIIYDDNEYAITIIDYDSNWKKHSHEYI